MRALAIELRRANGPVAALLLVAFGALLVAFSYSYWRSSSALAAQELGAALMLLTPIALAYGAMLGRREKRTRAVELMGSTGRPRWQRFLPSTAAVGLGVATPFLVVTAACAVAIAAGDGYLSRWDAAIPLIGALTLAGAAWLGIAAGRAWASPILPPALATATAVALFISPPIAADGHYTRWHNLSLVPAPGPATHWETPTAAALLAQLSLAAGLVAAGLLLIGGRSWFTRTGAAAVLAAGVAGLMLIVEPGPAEKWRLDPAAQRLTCTDDAPQVCVTAVHRHLLPEVTVQARLALDALAVLPGAPTRAVEVHLYRPGDNTTAQWQRFTPNDEPGTVYFVTDTPIGGDPGLAERIAMGGGTYLSHCGDQTEGYVPMAVAGGWLLGVQDFRLWEPGFGYWSTEAREPEVREGLRALRALPEAEQLARVTAVRDAALRCAPDLTTPLTAS
ncbi:hypothetical protein ACIA8K_39310 [Catenuloplanes sp. NPDC051500]|uniref:hypothetical protein n=1 Tax=Catenuloplanes sp. NPDC051500 TaxID=3363959 RepID=UPI0037A66AE3